MSTLFFSYSHADEALRNELEKHLAMLKREGAIAAWHDRRIITGEPVDPTISHWLQDADVILLLVSADFLHSEYCYGIEMQRAMERHAAEQVRVIPVILRPCDWQSAPFGKLLATPKDGKAVTLWPNQDEAFLDVAKAIRAALAATNPTGGRRAGVAALAPGRSEAVASGYRSSNLRVRKPFTDRDRDSFLDESFDFMAQYFDNSLKELHARNSEIEGTLKRDGNRFEATVYRDGKALSRCVIRLGGRNAGFGSGITFSHGLSVGDNSFNESISVADGEHTLELKPLGMATLAGGRDRTLSREGAAEYYWSIFIEPLQR